MATTFALMTGMKVYYADDPTLFGQMVVRRLPPGGMVVCEVQQHDVHGLRQPSRNELFAAHELTVSLPTTEAKPTVRPKATA